MSDATPASKQPNQEKLRQYLTFMLNASPQDESERIVSKRMKAMRLKEDKPAESTASHAAQENLLEAKAKLEEVRAGIWDQPIDTLQSKLNALSESTPQHLKPLVERLQVILQSRPQLAALDEGEQTQYEMDADFLTVYKQVLSSNPQERAELRERAVMAFRNRHLRKHGRKTLKHLQAKVPELCELEAEWIGRLKRQRGTIFTLETITSMLPKIETTYSFKLGLWNPLHLLPVVVIVGFIAYLLFIYFTGEWGPL